MKKQVLIISILILLIVPLVSAAEPWIIDGNKVYFEDSRAYLSSTPHTLNSPGWVTFNITSKQFSGEVDVVWGYNNNLINPRSAYLYKPHLVSWLVDSYHTFKNVSNIDISVENCEYGNEYNKYKRNVTYKICDDWEILDKPTCTSYIDVESIVCFDSYEQIDDDYQVLWKTNKSKMENWVDFSSSLTSVDYEFNNMNKWHYIKNVKVTAGESYIVKSYVDMPITLEGISGKYFFAIKRSSDTIQEAISSDRFYFLDPWYNTDWKLRKNISIDFNQVEGSSHSNFPVLINITDSDLAADAHSNGTDIVFTDVSATKLDHEIEFYNGTDGTLVAWVRIPTLSNTVNTTISMYYNNTGVASQENPTGVWNEGYVAVYHLSETPPAYVNDSTSNNFNGSFVNSDAGDQITGQIDGSVDFIDPEYVTLGSTVGTSLAITGNLTLSGWVNAQPNDYGTMLSSANIFSSGYWIGWGDTQGFFFYLDGVNNMVSSNDINDAVWTYVTGVFNGSDMWLYENKTLVKNATGLSGTITNHGEGTLAEESAYYALDGILDEIRISNVSRSTGWINTSYNSQFSPSTFSTVGAEEEVPSITCSCPTVNTNWAIDMSDYCILTLDCNLGTGNLSFTGVGNFTVNATLNVSNILNLNTDNFIYLKSLGRINIG